LTVLSERHDLKQRLASLEIKVANLETESKTEIAELHHKINTLSLASEGYRKSRNRFLDVYRRDVRNDLDLKGRQNIADGNEAAHHGDAVADAALYISGERLDHGIIIEIYGLHPADIASLGKC